jgi:hypothetical protein
MSEKKNEPVDEYIKPGWKTSEFWVMVASAFFGILILTGIMTNMESNTMLAYVNNIAGSMVTIVSVASYILSRGKAKAGKVNYTKLVNDIEALVNAQNTKMMRSLENNQRILMRNLSEKK